MEHLQPGLCTSNQWFENESTVKDGLNELLKIGSYKLFARPFDTATLPGKGADIDYNHN